ncbi:glycosyltransferase [Arthrobacter glacialis]|uniref:glycosyltransferase n=1 Tax=Arthrobacter glacialis TaxID=1664 RepID=UPI000CD3CFBA|nr:glycosyltransferase [Arthrobacter glacialis]POH58455.1 glycosyl transferase [Arthrobacter glacialis]
MGKVPEDNIAAVVSLYNPDAGVVAHCAALMEQVGHVVAVDDGSPNDCQGILAQLESMGAQVVRLRRNSGIAGALNAGIRAAREHASNPVFILTMDQDSLLEPGYTAKLLAAHEVARANGVTVGMVAPGSISGLPTRRRGAHKDTLLGGEPIQSGLLIPCEALDSIGLLMEELFIDGVDTEFYLRARDAGMESVLAPEARLEHALGSMVVASLFGIKIAPGGRPLRIRTAASYRYYYVFRNRLLLLRKYWRTQPAWALKGVLADYRHLAIVTALAPGRGKRLASALAGVRDGFAGISGQRTPR